jgi:hypothetical protein
MQGWMDFPGGTGALAIAEIASSREATEDTSYPVSVCLKCRTTRLRKAGVSSTTRTLSIHGPLSFSRVFHRSLPGSSGPEPTLQVPRSTQWRPGLLPRQAEVLHPGAVP